MSGLPDVLAGLWEQVTTKWTSIPSHIRMIVTFLVVRMISSLIKKRMSGGGGDKGKKAKKGAVQEVLNLEDFNQKVAAAGKAGKVLVVGLYKLNAVVLSQIYPERYCQREERERELLLLLPLFQSYTRNQAKCGQANGKSSKAAWFLNP
jgi:hypothetical protein